MAGITPPAPPQGVPGFEGASDISDTGDYFINGDPAHTIKALARYWAKPRVSICHCNGGSYIRAAFSHEPARLEVALLGMQGLGQPGCNQMLFTEFGLFSSKEVNIFPGGEEIPNVGGAYRGREDIWRENQIPKTMVPQGLRGDHIQWRSHLACGLPRDDQFTGPFEYPLPTSKAGVKMIWSDAPCWTTCWNGGNTFQDAVRNPDIEFYMIQHIWMENDCNFADLLLPVTTKFEDTDISTDDENGAYCGGHARCMRSASRWDRVCVCCDEGRFHEL